MEKETLCSSCRSWGGCIYRTNEERSELEVNTGLRAPEEGEALKKGWRDWAKVEGCPQLSPPDLTQEVLDEEKIRATLSG